MIKKLIIVVIGGTFLSPFFISGVLAYGVETHAFLTDEIIKFYNRRNTEGNGSGWKISEDLINYIIDGARHEDTNPRYLNHFYDPINNRGLADGIYKGQGSKYWAQDEKNQSAFIYKLFARTADTILTADQFSKIDSVYYKTNFTWQKAIDLYANGKDEEAFFALGHILHLIEDAAVPDHTRNDAHPPYDDGGSPYENWTKKFSLKDPDPDLAKKLQSKKIISLSDLNNYFDGIASYSNNNFYSRDSIRSYKNPALIKSQREGAYIYGVGNDGEGDYFLIRKTGSYFDGKIDDLEFNTEDSSIEADLILEGYWSRLSVKSIQHGAGVLDLFLREGEKAREKLAREKAGRPYLGMLMDGFGKIFEFPEGRPPVEGGPRPALKEDRSRGEQNVATSEELKLSSDVTEKEKEKENVLTSEELKPSSDVGEKENISILKKTEPTSDVKEENTPTPIPTLFFAGGSGGGSDNQPTSEESKSASDVDSTSIPTPTPTPSTSSGPTPTASATPTSTPTPSPFPTPTPEFLKSVSFYKNPANEKYYLNLSWDEYPFISTKFNHLVSDQPANHNWHAVLFYYDQTASPTDDLFWINLNASASHKSWGLTAPGGLKIKYPNCQSTETSGSSLILPDSSGDCDALAGNHASFAIDFNQLEDNLLILEVINDKVFSPSLEGPIPDKDYVSLAYYAYQPGYEPNNYGLKLIKTDPNKYYFQDNSPSGQAPTKPENIAFDFNVESQRLKISWDKSSDPDTLDKLISYEIKYASSSMEAVDNFVEISVEPGKTYDFEIKAKDNDGNISDPTLVPYAVPDIPLPYNLEIIEWGMLDDSGQPKIKIEFSQYPFTDSGKPGTMIFFLNQDPPENYQFLDDDYRNVGKIGGSNSVLGLNYMPCDFNGTWKKPVNGGGLVFANTAECPSVANGIFLSVLSLAKITAADASYQSSIGGVFANEELTQREFIADDYITVGFYELGPRDQQGGAYFKNTTNYGKKIYFQE